MAIVSCCCVSGLDSSEHVASAWCHQTNHGAPVPEQALDMTDQAPVVDVPTAAKRLGKSVDAIRALARRGRLQSRRGNDGKLLITLPTGTDVAPPVDDESDDEVVELREQLAEVREQVEHWRELATGAQIAAARAEADAAAQRELVTVLTRLLEDGRRPWWRRWMGAGSLK